MDCGRLVQHAKRHGFYGTALACSFAALRRVIDFGVMRVYLAPGWPTKTVDVPGYVTRCATEAEYEAGPRAFEGDHQRKWAFERGDRCFANFRGDQMVGYTFYGLHSTVVRPGSEVQFPDTLIYAYAGFTQPTHRGRRLALARSNMRKMVDQDAGAERRTLWYVDVDNYDPRAVSPLAGGALTGYVGYPKFGQRFSCFASPGCKREGVSLVRTSQPEHPSRLRSRGHIADTDAPKPAETER